MKGAFAAADPKFNIDYNCQESEISYTKKISNFTIVLTFVGLVHLYHTLTLIRETLLGHINAKSVTYFILKFSFP